MKVKVGIKHDAEFTTIEEGLYLRGKLEESGNISWKGIARSEDVGNTLTFSFNTEYESIQKLISEVGEILKNYPVIGSSR